LLCTSQQKLATGKSLFESITYKYRLNPLIAKPDDQLSQLGEKPRIESTFPDDHVPKRKDDAL